MGLWLLSRVMLALLPFPLSPFPTFPEVQFHSLGAPGQLGQDKGDDLPKVLLLLFIPKELYALVSSGESVVPKFCLWIKARL